MLRKIQTPDYQAFLAGYRIPEIEFSDHKKMPSSLRPVWTALQAGAPDIARKNAQRALDENRLFAADEKAGLLVGLAAAQLELGSTDQALTAATRSLEMHPKQWAANRIRLGILANRRDYSTSYETLSELKLPKRLSVWDDALTDEEVQLSLAGWSWVVADWDRVATHLDTAYPDGLAQMPIELREDWFRLSFYRNQPDQAAAAAALIIHERSVERADELLQTIVQHGWTSQALPLYKSVYDRQPQNELLRRRLVGLCIKEGDIEEARRLTAPGALRTAA